MKTFFHFRMRLVALMVILLAVMVNSIQAADWVLENKQSGGVFRGIIYVGEETNKWVIVGDEGLVWTNSTEDGAIGSWVVRNPGTTLNLYAITYGLGRFVAVGYRGIILSSENGTTWTIRNQPGVANTPTGNGLNSVAFNGTDLFVAGGLEGRILTSPDGITWTEENRVTTDRYYSMSFGNGRFVTSAAAGRIYHCVDGVNWVKASANTGVNNTSSLFENGLFLVGGGNGSVYTSTDGISWTNKSSKESNYVHALTYSGSDYIGVGNADGYTCSMIIVSPTTNTWVRDRTPDNTVLLGVCSNKTSKTIAVGARLLLVTNTIAGAGEGKSCGASTLKTITVVAPNGGEELSPGATFNIKWNSTNVTDPVRIRYSTNNGSSYTIIADSTTNDGSYEWKVPTVNSSQCLVRINAVNVSGSPYDESNSTFTIGTPTPVNTIRITSPNGGEVLTGGTTHNITWSSSTKFNKVDIEYNNGSSWSVVVTGTADDGSHIWTVPNISTTKAELWIKGYDGDTNPTDYTDAVFTITPAPSGSITITSPNGGEVWAKSSTENITWTSSGQVGNVKISYSTDGGVNWTSIVSSTANDGSHSWSLPDLISDRCLVKVSDVSNAIISDVSNNLFAIGGPPQIMLDKDRLNFGYAKNGITPCTQTLFVYNGGGGSLNWTAAADATWIHLNPASGNAGEDIIVSIDPSSLGTGTYSGTVTITDTGAVNSPQTVAVFLTVKNSNQDEAPFGAFATPEDGTANVSGSIAVTGWVLDDICLESLKIYRVVGGEDSYIGDAIFVEGARPDVEQAYPDYPYNSRAGWGYMLLTNFVPDGELILKAIARDNAGRETVLGTKTITVDNANAVKPFGAIDAPEQGGSASGNKYRNNGWALTPTPNTIPKDGSTINVFIDGTLVGKATYNLYRADIASLFPGYNNTDGSWGYLDIDTTAYGNGVHTIAWSVTDNAGNNDGVGSRYFTVRNTGGASRSSAYSYNMGGNLPQSHVTPMLTPKTLAAIPNGDSFDTPVRIKTGYNENSYFQEIYPDSSGIMTIETRELERLQIEIPGYSMGYMAVNGKLRFLPIGSTMNPETGVFCWQPGVGFQGVYDLVFIGQRENGEIMKTTFRVNILPRFEK